MSCWNILGITPTRNIKEIKKAYSKLIKLSIVDKNGEQFNKLTKAYNKALSLANTSINDLNTSLIKSSNFDILSALINSSIDSTDVNSTKKFISKVEEIYFNPSLRFNKECWLELLSLPILEDINLSSNLERELITFLSNHKYLPNNIYKLFDARFNWINRIDELKSTYPSEHINILINELINDKYLTYNYLSDIDNSKLEEYLTLRETAFININNLEFKSLKDTLLKAYSIYSKDLDLLKLLGTYYLSKNDNIMSLKYFKEAFNIDNNDMLTLSKLGYLFTKCEQYSKAILYLERYIKRLGNSIDINSLENLAYCYNHSYELQKSYELYKLLFKLNPWNLSFRNNIMSINEKIEKSNVDTDLHTSICKRYINYYLNPFMKKLHHIYSNFKLRVDENSWSDLLLLPIARNNDLFYLLEYYVIEFLTTNQNIPKCIFTLLDNHFNWTNRQSELAKFYSQLNINLLLKKLTLNEHLSSTHLTSCNSDIVDEYLNYRNLAYKLINTNSKDAETYLEKALILYNGDYELYKLYGQYYLNNNSYYKSIASFKVSLSMKEDDYYSCCSLALLLSKTENYKEAIYYLEKSVNTPAGALLLSNDDFLTKYAICYYYNNDLMEAKKYFKKLYKLNPNIHFINTYLKNINDRLLGKKREIIPIDAITNPNYVTKSFIYTTKIKLNNMLNKIMVKS